MVLLLLVVVVKQHIFVFPAWNRIYIDSDPWNYNITDLENFKIILKMHSVV